MVLKILKSQILYFSKISSFFMGFYEVIGNPNVFRNLLSPTFWVSEFRKPKCVFAIFYYPYFGCPKFGNPDIFVQNFHFLWYSCNYLWPRFWVSEFRKPKCVFAIFYYPYFGCPNFGNPNFRPNPLAMLCCYYHFPHRMRQTIEIRISSTVSLNFGRIVRKSKKFHTNDSNIVKTCRNLIGEISSPRTNHFFIAVELHHRSEQNRIFFLNVQKFKLNSAS